jgi:hypothetical protein
MRSTHSFDYVGFLWSPDAEQPSLPDSPYSPLDDEEAQQREFVEEIYRDLGVGD